MGQASVKLHQCSPLPHVVMQLAGRRQRGRGTTMAVAAGPARPRAEAEVCPRGGRMFDGFDAAWGSARVCGTLLAGEPGLLRAPLWLRGCDWCREVRADRGAAIGGAWKTAWRARGTGLRSVYVDKNAHARSHFRRLHTDAVWWARPWSSSMPLDAPTHNGSVLHARPRHMQPASQQRSRSPGQGLQCLRTRPHRLPLWAASKVRRRCSFTSFPSRALGAWGIGSSGVGGLCRRYTLLLSACICRAAGGEWGL